MVGVRRGSQKRQQAWQQDAAAPDFALWESELRPRRWTRLGNWLLRAFGDVAHRDGFVLVSGGGVCWHCYVPTQTAVRTPARPTARNTGHPARDLQAPLN